MKRALGLACLALVGCKSAAFNSLAARSPVDVQNIAKDQAAANDMQKQCDVIAKRVPDIQEETALGGAVALNWIKSSDGLLIDGKPLQDAEKYLNTVGKNLATQSSRPTIDWTFGILKADAFNAVSAPAGYVFVAKGLLKHVDTEAQLAGVLAHEIAHVTQRHALKTYTRLLVEPCENEVLKRRGKSVGDVAASFVNFAPSELQTVLALGSATGKALNLDSNWELLGKLTDGTVKKLRESGYSKDDEYEADQVALELVINAGYNPNEYIQFLGKIPEKDGLLTAHPANRDRQEKLAEWLKDHSPKKGEFSSVPTDVAALQKVPLKGQLAAVKK